METTLNRPNSTARRIVYSSRGRQHGPITRVFSPGDVGRLTKPFVFLDYFDFVPKGGAMFAMHPHSGIATTTVLLSGSTHYEDTTGASGILEAGSVEWFNAGGGAWHDGVPVAGERLRGYQLWLALPPDFEHAAPSSQYLVAADVPTEGPVRVILGRYGAAARSQVNAPGDLAYLHVRLAAGQRWTYSPPSGHTVAWLHANQGSLQVAGMQLENGLTVFSESNAALDFIADSPSEFMLASASKHPHDLVLGSYSVHSSAAALHRGETEIARIGEQLRARGRID